jgi:hypothetical protein
MHSHENLSVFWAESFYKSENPINISPSNFFEFSGEKPSQLVVKLSSPIWIGTNNNSDQDPPEMSVGRELREKSRFITSNFRFLRCEVIISRIPMGRIQDPAKIRFVYIYFIHFYNQVINQQFNVSSNYITINWRKNLLTIKELNLAVGFLKTY